MRRTTSLELWNNFKEYIRSNNGMLLDTDFVHNGDYYTVQCDKHHSFKLTPRYLWYYTKNQLWCRQCIQFETFKKMVTQVNITLLSTEWYGISAKYQFRCPQGHLFSIKGISIYIAFYKHANLCRKCATIKTTQGVKKYHDQKGRVSRDGTFESSQNRFKRVIKQKHDNGYLVNSQPPLTSINPHDACKVIQCDPCVKILDTLCQYINLPESVTSQPNFNIGHGKALLEQIKRDRDMIVIHIRNINKKLNRMCKPARPLLICAVSVYDYYKINQIQIEQYIISQTTFAQLFHTNAISMRNLLKHIHSS